jgi:hypothetical protein
MTPGNRAGPYRGFEEADLTIEVQIERTREHPRFGSRPRLTRASLSHSAARSSTKPRHPAGRRSGSRRSLVVATTFATDARCSAGAAGVRFRRARGVDDRARAASGAQRQRERHARLWRQQAPNHSEQLGKIGYQSVPRHSIVPPALQGSP